MENADKAAAVKAQVKAQVAQVQVKRMKERMLSTAAILTWT